MPRSFCAVGFAVAAAFLASFVGSVNAQPKAGPAVIPPTFPTLTTPANLGAKPGEAAEIVLTGTNLLDATGVWTSFGGKATIPEGQKDATKLKVTIAIPKDAKPGLHFFRVATKAGVSNARPICFDDLPAVLENEKNRTKAAPQVVASPAVIVGKADVESGDFFKVPVVAGKPITFEVLARRLGSPMDPVIIVSDGAGRELGGVYADDTPGLQSDCRLTYTPPKSGDVIVEVRDSTYRGGADYAYRLRIDSVPGATTAFPLVIERGKPAKVTFTGPDVVDVKAVDLVAPKDPLADAVYATSVRTDGKAGWPVPVRLSDIPQIVELEPNNDAAKATKLTVPGGASARFLEKNDVDFFSFPVKKGIKYAVVATTYEHNSPAEVYLRVLDAKGAELGKSVATTPTARVEVTAAADGDLTVACEHLNYLAGPSEVYHLAVSVAAPDFAVTVGLDRVLVSLNGTGNIPIVGITKLNGFNAPIELSVVSADGLTGTLTIPAAGNPLPATPLLLPVTAKADSAFGLRIVAVKATAKIDGKDVVRYATVADVAKAAMSGLPNPPAELLNIIAVAVGPEVKKKDEPKKEEPKKK